MSYDDYVPSRKGFHASPTGTLHDVFDDLQNATDLERVDTGLKKASDVIGAATSTIDQLYIAQGNGELDHEVAVSEREALLNDPAVLSAFDHTYTLKAAQLPITGFMQFEFGTEVGGPTASDFPAVVLPMTIFTYLAGQSLRNILQAKKDGGLGYSPRDAAAAEFATRAIYAAIIQNAGKPDGPANGKRSSEGVFKHRKRDGEQLNVFADHRAVFEPSYIATGAEILAKGLANDTPNLDVIFGTTGLVTTCRLNVESPVAEASPC